MNERLRLDRRYNDWLRALRFGRFDAGMCEQSIRAIGKRLGYSASQVQADIDARCFTPSQEAP